MRKLLLATVATLGGSLGVAAVAEAQTTSPAPGTVTVRLNGRVRAYAGIINDRDADNSTNGTTTTNVVGIAPGNTSTTTTTAGAGNLGGSQKQTNYSFGTYARLYPGFDGVAANGLRYGASLEIRQDVSGGAGGGAYGSVSSNSPRRGTLYFRRQWGYIGTAQLGTIRVGTTDGPSSLYATGTFENFDSGGLNGDHPGFATGTTIINWPFATQGATYATNKIVYLSPQLFGFDFGIAYEPNTGGNSGLADNGCNAGNDRTSGNPISISGGTTSLTNVGNGSGPGCDRLSSTFTPAEFTRRRNLVDLALRYRGTFGGFGIAATAGYIGSGVVRDASNLTPNPNTRFEGLSIGDFGAAVTFAGASIGGHYQFGRYNGAYVPVPRNVQDAQAWLVGASYTIGPAVLGAHYLDYQSAGNVAQAAQGRERREFGFAAGATYTLAPGLSLFASYVYMERRQNGQNFFGANTPRTVASVYALGTSFSW